ncbi:hypothetical protein [Sphaerisporangium sp. NPDC051011]|uniref:hypothetical protein n=1 Tax=Sphaerisporangium sp. NPDC051011 TaxID=3155792 RepID=UPI003406C46B
MSDSVVHITGLNVQVGAQLRQRCAWCGAVLIDYALDRIAVPEGQDPQPAVWPVGALVEVDGPGSWIRPHVDGAQLPLNACAQIDHEVTGATMSPETAMADIAYDPGKHDPSPTLDVHGVALQEIDRVVGNLETLNNSETARIRGVLSAALDQPQEPQP